MNSDDNDSNAEMDTENEAGVADWSDFGSFDVIYLF